MKIPPEFTIEEMDRVASTCTRLEGFSDEINCEFDEDADERFGYYLYVYGGFDSNTFDDLTFSFTLAEV